jgi:IQ calmodulin-binding motif
MYTYRAGAGGVQRVFRGYIARLYFAWMKKHWLSAITIQSVVR